MRVINDIAQLISNYFPRFATILTTILFVVFMILNISQDYDKIVSFVKRVFDLRRHIDSLFYENKRKKMNKTLYQKDYLEWQKDILSIIYSGLIEEKNEELQKLNSNCSIGFTEIDVKNDKNTYESITLQMEPVDFPFRDVCPKNKEYFKRKKLSKEKEPQIVKDNKKIVNEYYRLIKETIRYPKRVGFMLDSIEINTTDKHNDLSSPWYLKSYVGIYENNLKTSHIMEYELYKYYISYTKNKKNNLIEKYKNSDSEKEKKIIRDKILSCLPIRKYIHDQFRQNEKESDVLISGKYRNSLLGVQAFVIVKNYSGSYDALRIRRSENVSAKPGFIQFIPSGGFESMNDCNDYDSQWDNYSLTKSIFRELLEECFGQNEDDKAISGNTVSPDRIYSNNHIKKLIHMLEDGTAQMQLMGTSMNLVGLRQELSFILKIDDYDFANELIGNYESKSAVHLVDIKNLESEDFWTDDDLKNLNCTSAGLFELARNSKIYRDCL